MDQISASSSLSSEVKVAQLCLTLCNPMDSPWNSPDQNTGVGSLSHLQGIFPTQGSNPDLPHCVDPPSLLYCKWGKFSLFSTSQSLAFQEATYLTTCKVQPVNQIPGLFSGRLYKIWLNKVNLSSLRVSGHIWLHEPPSLIWYFIYSIKYSSRIRMLIAV